MDEEDDSDDLDGPEAVPPGLLGARSLRARGLTPVPLRPAGQEYRRNGETVVATGKEPLHEDFAARALRAGDEEDVRTWTQHPDAGVGVLLGAMPWDHPHRDGWAQGDGIADVEVDDPGVAEPTLDACSAAPPPRRCASSPRGRAAITISSGSGRISSPIWASPASPLPSSRTIQLPGRGDPARELLPPRDRAVPVRLPAHGDPPQGRYAGAAASLDRGRDRAGTAGVAGRPGRELGGGQEVPGAAGCRGEAHRERDEPLPREELVGLDPLEKFLFALDHHAHPYQETSAGKYSCSCTAADHPDSDPSMTFKGSSRGNLLAKCHSRDCPIKAIMEGIGLLATDAFAKNVSVDRPRRTRHWAVGDGSESRTIDLIQDEEAEAWEEEQDEYAAALAREPELRRILAETLRLPGEVLGVIQLGYRERNWGKGTDGDWVDLGEAWTWPEHDHRGRVVGIHRRFVDPDGSGTKKKLIGTRRDRETGAITHRAARVGHPVRLQREAGAGLPGGGRIGRAGPDLRRQGGRRASRMQGGIARGGPLAAKRPPRIGRLRRAR